jgi:hypothetical protein
MKKKIISTICWTVCIVFLCAAVWFLCAFFGNPISSALAKSTAKRYLEENYPDADFIIEKVSYDMKSGGYHVYVESPSSIDSHFYIYCDWLGRYNDDTSSCMTDGSNTYVRLTTEYWNLVREKLPYADFDIGIGFGDLRVAGVFEIYDYLDEKGERKHYTLTKDYGLDISSLILDGEYDLQALGRQHGSLSVRIHDEIVSVERAAEVLLELKAHLDKQGLPFHAIDFTLSAPRNENGQSVGPSIRLIAFLYSDIYEEGLADRVQANWNITQEHSAIQDGLKTEAELLIPYFIEIPEN